MSNDALIDELAALTRAHPMPFVSAPIVEPNDGFFPEEYVADGDGITGLASCLLVYAGFEQLSVELALDERAVESHAMLTSTRIDLAGVEGDVVHLSCTKVGGIETALPAVAFEIARTAWLLRPRSATPFRSAPLPAFRAPEETAAERRVSSVYAFVIGLGLIALEGSHRYRQAGRVQGRQVVTEWIHDRYGALEPDEAAHLFAIQLCIRGYDDERIAALLGMIGQEHADAVRAILPGLDRDVLIAQLGLPAPAEWPEE